MGWIYETSGLAVYRSHHGSPFLSARGASRLRAEGLTGEEIKSAAVTRGFGVRDGHGIVFVSSTGDICPAGFLPVVAGKVEKHIVDVYRGSDLFQALHDPAQFEGRCGHCEYHALCGGSRSRAYAATGNPLESDPFCGYEPRARTSYVEVILEASCVYSVSSARSKTSRVGSKNWFSSIPTNSNAAKPVASMKP